MSYTEQDTGLPVINGLLDYNDEDKDGCWHVVDKVLTQYKRR
jgi:hypothetical protein